MDVCRLLPRCLIAAASAVIVTAFLAPAGAHAEVVTSGSTTLVNDDPHTTIGAPVNGTLPRNTPDYSSLDAVLALVANTPPGESLHAAFWQLDHIPGHDMVDALGDVEGRGVDVSIVVDADATPASVVTELQGSGVAVTTCAYACTGSSQGIAHNKFFLFSKTVDPSGATRTEVVANGSQNIDDQQMRVHNNFVISYDDHGSYTGFLNYWQAMHDKTADAGNGAVSTPAVSDDGTITTYFFPRTHDVVADFVGRLDCSKGGHIYAQSATWTSDRTALNDELEAQADHGCKVSLLMDDSNAPVHNDGTPASEDALDPGTNKAMNANVFALHGISVYGTLPGGCRYTDHSAKAPHNCHGADGGTHEKFMVIQGKSSSGADVFQALSGSENFTQPALTEYTDDTQVFTDPAIVQGFLDDFDRQQSETVTISPEKYPDATYTTVNSAAGGSQDMPSVARAGGYTAVAWADTANPAPAAAGNHGAVYLKLTRADGSTVYEVPIQTLSAAVSDYRHPSVGLDGNGDAVVAWQDDADGNGSYDIVMRRVTDNGTPSPVIGSRVTVNGTSAGDQTSPALAETPTGQVSVVWTDEASGVAQIRMATFAADGSKVGELQVNGVSTGSHSQPDVSVYPRTGGDWASVVVWRDDSDGNGSSDVHGRAVTSTGSGVWAEKRLNETGSGDQTVPAVSADSSGFVAVWETDTRSTTSCHTYAVLAGEDDAPAKDTSVCVQAREFDASGTAAAAEFEVSKGLFDTNAYASHTEIGDQRAPDVALDDAGHYVVAWQELTPYRCGWDVFARSFTAGAGSTASTLSEYRMNPVLPHDQMAPGVATDGAGNFVLAYTDDADGNESTQLVESDGFRIG